jgi:hypothetical protein
MVSESDKHWVFASSIPPRKQSVPNRKNRKMEPTEYQTSCPNCSGNIAYAIDYEGHSIDCPHGCGATVLLSSPQWQPEESSPQWQPQDHYQPVVAEEDEEESDWSMGIKIFVAVILILVAKDMFFDDSTSPAPNTGTPPPSNYNPANSNEPPRKTINKDERLADLKSKLLGKKVEEIVAIMGKPYEVGQGGRNLMYQINEEDPITGAVYKHIQIIIDGDSGKCWMIGIGHTDLR